MGCKNTGGYLNLSPSTSSAVSGSSPSRKQWRCRSMSVGKGHHRECSPVEQQQLDFAIGGGKMPPYFLLPKIGYNFCPLNTGEVTSPFSSIQLQLQLLCSCQTLQSQNPAKEGGTTPCTVLAMYRLSENRQKAKSVE